MKTWEFWIDRGGTFTDCIAKSPDGILHNTKVLSSDKAPLIAIRKLLSLDDSENIPPISLSMGTTLATNALLERKGSPHALVVTKGFKDLLEIGTQQRPELFTLAIKEKEILPQRVFEVEERVDASGSIIEAVNHEHVKKLLLTMYEDGIRNIAISLMHATKNPTHEQLIAKTATEIGFHHISCGHQVCPEVGYTARTETSCIDAFLTPVLSGYLKLLSEELPGSSLSMMQSSGGLIDASLFRGHNSILSGPAAGVIATERLAHYVQHPKMIAFDMGGTSTDVARIDGKAEHIFETSLDGLQIKTPLVNIYTIAAGGGSICRYQGGRFLVGPESAGSFPGPLCYGLKNEDGTHAARELTITDINLFLGILDTDNFPFPLQGDRVEYALKDIQKKLKEDGREKTLLEIAHGFHEILTVKMAEAVKQTTLSKGFDVRQYALCAFGGAGGQHAIALAERLGIKRIYSHPFAGVFSAYGIGLADTRYDSSLPLQNMTLSKACHKLLRADIENAIEEGRQTLGLSSATLIETQVTLDCRYRGTVSALSIPLQEDTDPCDSFKEVHQRHYGYLKENTPIDVLQLRVSITLPSKESAAQLPRAPEQYHGDKKEKVIWLNGIEVPCPCVHRKDVASGETLTGPLIVFDESGTLLLTPPWKLTKDSLGIITMNRDDKEAASDGNKELDDEADPITLEAFHALFMSLAEHMGVILQRTAVSTNVKERLDFSCALFDSSGSLIANAPHMPVHLGAMGESVRAIISSEQSIQEGDVFLLNSPNHGGSHLPDLTVISPVFIDGAIQCYVANRAHHADVGGVSPGSMPANSRSLKEEGIIIEGVKIVDQGKFLDAVFEKHFLNVSYPVRNPHDSRSDLEAQIAANQAGIQQFNQLVADRGLEQVKRYMQFIMDNAAFHVREALSSFPNGNYSFSDSMDDGTSIAVNISIENGTAVIDFSSSGAQHPGNLNAPKAVVRSATLYVLRCIVDEAIPLNEGCLQPITLIIPGSTILSPGPEAAVAGGNVETSQRVVDVLLGALGIAAASQGTMNNITFGKATMATYETICGGAGATANASGRSAVHTHMTNTRITDPEVLEERFPVQIKEFSIRKNSGGKGKYHGGDGVRRHYQFLEDCEVSLLTERRQRAPFGLSDGSPGEVGINWHIDTNGNHERLAGKVHIQVKEGEGIVLETPGGGGFGGV